MSLDIESIIDETEPAETSVTICTKGKLRAEYERLDARLDAAPAAAASLAGPSIEVAARMAELREQMRAHERVFNLRAIDPLSWSNLVARRPVKAPAMNDEEYAALYHEWVCGIVAASVADPAMTVAQAARFRSRLSSGDWSKLANAAYAVNDDSSSIPFSVAASVLSRSSGERSKPPEPSGNPDHGSLAGSPDPSPSTSTTTPVD